MHGARSTRSAAGACRGLPRGNPTAPLRQSFAAQLARLSEALSAHARWPSPPLGFAVHLFRELHLDGLPELAVSFSVGNLDEAPNLAASGYWLSWNLSSQTEQERALWRTSLERLSKRDPFPRDRQTFALRPVELLGITLGVVTNERLGGSKADWLRDVVNRIPEHGAKDIWCQALSAYAACLLGLSWPESLESRLDRFNNAELGLLICLLHFPQQRPVLPGWDTIRLADACCELLRRCEHSRRPAPVLDWFQKPCALFT
jgi:hypothetical protein